MGIDKKIMAKALVQAIWLWADERHNFPKGINTKFDEDWFVSFIGDWKVARTIKEGDKIKVFDLLRKRFFNPSGRLLSLKAKDIDDIADELAKDGLTPLKRVPRSLVSKTAFFCSPDKFPPLDKFALKGKNQRRGGKRKTGKAFLKAPNYQSFRTAWEVEYKKETDAIKRECSKKKWKPIAESFGVSFECLQKNSFAQKVFDNVLNFEAKGRDNSFWGG